MKANAEILLEGVGRTFPGPAPLHALKGVSLEVERGAFCLVQGPSGSGKTTLLALTGGLDRPTAGRVHVAGQELTTLRERWLLEFRRTQVGFVFQDFRLLDVLTAEENVRLGLELRGWRAREARATAREMLERLGLGARRSAPVKLLSGGEKQRVAVARALAGGPRVLLADEPTANLDWESGRAVVQAMREIARERAATVMAVSHDARLTEYADQVIELVDGRVNGLPAAREEIAS
ncbi:MAG: ABC transporter ATP-binding protein [Candidatus Eisenbacteria bacterium]|nr:ABC transporter ATP-binding protein [Candidatus Eisenbacteria bacterium]